MDKQANHKSHDRRMSARFNDGLRSIDFILAYRSDECHLHAHDRYRKQFESELEKLGLQLEYYQNDNAETPNQIRFVKIHAPWDTLTRQAEFLRLQMPIMENDLPARSPSWTSKLLVKIFNRNLFSLQNEYLLPKRDVFTDAFDRRRESQFLLDNKNRETFFSPAQKIAITWDIISGVALVVPVEQAIGMRQKLSWFKKKKIHDSAVDSSNLSSCNNQKMVKTIDIQFLLKENTYTAAFPVHDSYCNDNMEFNDVPVEKWPLRQYLYKSWANAKQWFRHQPLDDIRNYFGEKVALYFAWLGFYTKMLILPAIVGLISFLCGLRSLINDPFIDDFCSATSNMSGRTVCRLCPDTVCDYETVLENCVMAKLYTVFDNESTVFFSLFMAIWAVVFLELWKRRQSELCAQWDVSDAEFNEEKVRFEYQSKVSATKLNPITNKLEPFLPMKSKLRRLTVSISVAMFFILVVIGLLAAVMVYKTLGPIIWRQLLYDEKEKQTIMSPQLISSFTASIANGAFIAIMTKLYFSAAWALTNSEFPRTETEFENSYTYKVFVFQFVNFYGALFYLAFIRGHFMSPPHQQGSREARCPITGCLLDVSIQLAVVMIGKQALNNVLEIGLPTLRNWWRRRKFKNTAKQTQWELDYELDPVPQLHLTDDYLEMLIQYGFVTMFVAAFPLAPLFALLNNIVEIRLDARKHLCETRRCIPMRAKDLGPWFLLLTNVTKIAVLTNGLLIALTTDFVDRLLYIMMYSTDHTLSGYGAHIFSEFDPNDWNFEQPSNKSEFCIYRDYRKSPISFEKYQQTSTWWLVLTSKLLFVIVFEHIIFLLQTMIAFVIPDVPDHVVERQQREQYLQRQKFMQEEKKTSIIQKLAGSNNEDGLFEHSVETENETKSHVSETKENKMEETPKTFSTDFLFKVDSQI